MTTNNIKPLTFAFLDAPTGYGKTTAIIDLINSRPFERWLVVTPFKTEVDRICGNTSCVQPLGKKTKDILLLLIDEKNVCCTHALFDLFTTETLELLKGYNLIIDEEPTVIKNIVGTTRQSNKDCPSLIERYGLQDYKLALETKLLLIDNETGLLSWNDNHEYNTKQYKNNGLFNDLRERLEVFDLYHYAKTVIQCTKRETWSCFASVLICSYRMQESLLRYYCDIYKISIEWRHLEDGKIKDGYLALKPPKLNLLSPVGLPSDMSCSCSKYWYKGHFSKGKISDTAKKVRNAFRNLRLTFKTSERTLYYWTCYKEYAGDFADKNLSKKKWKPCNLRATNDLTECIIVGYFVNRFMNVAVKNFIESKGVEIDERALALSELIQFVWRSNIRTQEEKKVTVFIPAFELLKDFKDWLKE